MTSAGTPLSVETQAGPFAIDLERFDREVVLTLSGELDLYAAPRLRQQLIELANEPHPPKRIVLDVAGIDFIDSTGIGVMVGALKRVRHHGGDVVLRAPNARVYKVLELTALVDVFEIEAAP